MENSCVVCGSTYTSERSTKKYCSDKCKQKLKRQKASVNVEDTSSSEKLPQSLPLSTESGQTKWMPTSRESQLNNVVWCLMGALLDVERLLNPAQNHPTQEIIALAKKARHAAAACDTVWEVESFDTEQMIYDPIGFEQRTGIPTAKKLPLE